MNPLELFENNPLDLLENIAPTPQMAHAIVVHIPVALSVLGVVLVYASAAIAAERQTLRWVSVVAYLLLAASAYVAVETGESARARLSGRLPGPVWNEVTNHEDLAEFVWLFAVVTAAVTAVSTIPVRWVRIPAISLAMLASLGTAGWVAFTGHTGGALVYQHGLGVPPQARLEWRIPPRQTVAETGAPAAGEVDGGNADGNVTDGNTELNELNEEMLRTSNTATLDDDGTVRIPTMPIDPIEAATISYVNDIVPIFEVVCYECHQPDALDAEYDMTTMAGLLKGGEKEGPSIIPGKPDESPLVLYCTGELKPQMPEDDFPLTREEIHVIRMWIYAGAKDDSIPSAAEAP